MKAKAIGFIGLGALLLGLSGCQALAPKPTPVPPTATSVPATDTFTPQPTNTPQPPTATLTPSSTWTMTATPTATPTATDTASPTPTPTNTPMVYVVQAGDSLFDIASKFHVDVGALTSANELTITILSVGQNLIIPSEEFATPTPTPIPNDLPSGTKIQYKVLLGDTLESIAAKFNSTVSAISLANPDPGAPKNGYRHLNDQNIQAELVIIVPVNLVTPTPGG
jgi:LysM repeat protein